LSKHFRSSSICRLSLELVLIFVVCLLRNRLHSFDSLQYRRMIHFSDQPYRFFPPSYFAPTAWVIRRCNKRWLSTKLRITQVEVHGREHLDALAPATRVVLLPNHPTHCDASIILEVCRQIGVKPRVMAAYDLYTRGLLAGWVMKRLGCFSVDREGSDKPAMEEAAKTILDGRFALTMFPEGNVFLENDRIAPFHDGAAFLSIRAARQLAEKGGRVVCVPISTKATHLRDCRAEQRGVFKLLCEKVGIPFDSSKSPLDALRSIGFAALRQELKRRNMSLPNLGDPKDLVEVAAAEVLNALEPKLGLEVKSEADPLDRVRAARRIIHEMRTDPDRVADHEAAARYAEDAMLAFRLASYSGDYVAERPSLDRIGETLEKLYEDTHEVFLQPYSDRKAIVRFGEPIDVTTLLESGVKQKQLIHELTDKLERTCQSGIDENNRINTSPGKALWSTSMKGVGD
jgi:1-acyl-sn-glycerol-3-phosphate acyltransferase